MTRRASHNLANLSKTQHSSFVKAKPYDRCHSCAAPSRPVMLITFTSIVPTTQHDGPVPLNAPRSRSAPFQSIDFRSKAYPAGQNRENKAVSLELGCSMEERELSEGRKVKGVRYARKRDSTVCKVPSNFSGVTCWFYPIYRFDDHAYHKHNNPFSLFPTSDISSVSSKLPV